MKKFYSLLLLPALLFSLSSHAAWDIWQSRVLVNNGADVYLAGNLNAFADASLDGYYLGRFVSGGTLTMKGGELRTYKNSGSNVCGTAATGCFYRVYRTCDTPGSFINVQFPYNCEWPGAGCGNGAGDQKWEYISGTANLLFGLTAPGTYVFEVYWQIEGNETGGCGQFKYDSNSSNNFKAYFELNVNDSFSDGNFTATPTWSGDGSAFTVAAKSDAAGLLGTEVTKTNTLRLNAPAVTGSEYLSTQIATWQSQQDWYFWTGRRAQAATNSNRSYIWLYANEATLESGTVDGYRILIGDDTGNDEIFLERVDNGVGTVIFATTGAITNGITDWGVTLKVTRSQSGVWKIWTSTLPTIAGAGATALSCPEALSTVAQTNSLNSLLTATDTNYTPGANSYIGVVAFHTTGVGTLVAQEFDNFRMVTYPPDTFVNFTSASATINENLGGGTYTLTVAIGNPSATVATTVDVVLTSGSAARVNGYSTQTLTFPAGSSSNQTIVLTVTDNNLCDDIGYLNFQLQNIAGGLNAFVSAPTDFTLTIIDDNMGYQTLISDDFEDGNINGWTPVSSGTWNASSSAAASGTYSLRHVFTGAAGQAHVYADVDNACLPGIMTTWRFNLKTYNREPSPANKFLVFLSANENNLWGSTVDGYAIGVNPILSGDPDLLTLWRVDNGVPTIAIVTTAIDWGITQNEVGFEITRDENGLWTLNWDSNGDFDNLVSLGTGTELSYSDIGFFGARYIHTASLGGEIALDDITLSQKGCRYIYYSRATGNYTDAIWSTQPTGLPAPSTISPSQYSRLVIQSPHTVTLNANGICDWVTIDNGGTLDGGTNKSLKVFGNWINNGSFIANTSTVTMKGAVAQNILGSNPSAFYKLVIDNDFGTVNLNSATSVSSVLSPNEGTLQTNGNLTLLSSATDFGSIGAIQAGADVTGNVTLNRYLPAANQNWVYMGCPIPGKTIADWNDDIITTGFTGADYPPPYSFNNIYNYDETIPGGRNVGWAPATNVTNALSSQKGYTVYMTAAANTVDVTGSIQKGNVAVPLSYTNTGNAGDGWNLISNVYPSEIDWVAVEGNSSNVGSYYTFDSQLPGYRSYNANTLVGSGSRYLAHSQAFFVQTSSVGQLINFAETHKTSTNVAFERNTPESQLIRLRIERNGEADEAVIAFLDGATDNFESEYDAVKFESPVVTSPEFALMSADNQQLTIDARPSLSNDLSIPVYLDLPAAGDYSFMITEVLNLPAGSCITIEDTFNGSITAIESGSSLTVTTDAPFQGNRLIIHVSAPVVVATTSATCFGSDNGSIIVNTPQGNWNVSVINDLGTSIYSGIGSIVFDSAPAGDYTILMSNTEALCGSTELAISIAEPALMETSVGSSIDHCNMSNDGSIEIGVSNASSYNYSITNSSNEVIENNETTDFAVLIEGLSADVYTIEVITSCGVSQQVVDLKDPSTVDAAILASTTNLQIIEGQGGDIVFTSNADNATTFNWTINGSVASTDPSFTQTFDTEGDFVIHLDASNAACSASSDITVNVDAVVSITETGNKDAVTLIQMNGGVQISFLNADASTAEIRIYNAIGQIVARERGTSKDGQRVFVDMSSLSKGAYTVQVITSSAVLLSKQIVK